MASKEAKERVEDALLRGANPRGFSGENAEVYRELVAEKEAAEKPAAKKVRKKKSK
jgi:hypothetical protein